MKTIDLYITEKLHLNKNIKSSNNLDFSDWKTYVESIGCEININKENKEKFTFGLKNISDPQFNLKFFVYNGETYYSMSSVYLGKYDNKFDKEKVLDNAFWNKGYNKNYSCNKYCFTENNANLMKTKLENIIKIAK